MSFFITVQIIASIATTLSVVLAVCQLRKIIQQKRYEYIVNLYAIFIGDAEMVNIFYMIDYNIYRWKPSDSASAEEKQLDKLLGFFSMVARLHKISYIRPEDMDFFRYEIQSIYCNKEIQKYRQYLVELSETRHVPMKYNDFFDFAAELELN